MKNSIVYFIFYITLFSTASGCTHSKPDTIKPDNRQQPSDSTLSEYCTAFHILNIKIRDSKIKEDEAFQQIKTLMPKIKKAYYKQGGTDFQESSWYFPLQYYDIKAIGGTNGNGYNASKYNFFDGNKHLGHPAQDIFIYNKNHDCLDDNTQKPVNVLSMTGGVVIDTDTLWDVKSNLRGGKYIWIYDPYSNSLYYYAHNNKIFVKPGDIVEPGKVIATVGRTGSNAYKDRSPTHLHMMQLKMGTNYYPRPYDFYQNLIKTKISK